MFKSFPLSANQKYLYCQSKLGKTKPKNLYESIWKNDEESHHTEHNATRDEI